ncbi:hypothetical protein CEXT_628241 [Caerostris extrusa]|uniref:Uncharacterized protein n=1 Tax=Caerostris extrusa TaxID=172846 RepID=A0AAV4VQT7_CAEEX|nr:hypothetical protein CEXT_628241 [Caerostris extrusa]
MSAKSANLAIFRQALNCKPRLSESNLAVNAEKFHLRGDLFARKIRDTTRKSDYRTKLMSLVIEDEVAGLDLTNNELESMEGARLPEGMRHLLLANNRLRVLPPGLLDSLGELGRVTLSGNPGPGIAAPSASRSAGCQRHQVRTGRDGGCSREGRLVPHGFRPLSGQPRSLRHTRFRGSWFLLVGGRREDRLDAVPDAREGVALLARGALREGEGPGRGQGVRRLRLLQPQGPGRRHSGAHPTDRGQGPRREAVHPLQALPARGTHPTQHRARHPSVEEDGPRALQELSGQRVVHVRVQSGPHRSSQEPLEPHHYHQNGRSSQGQGAARRDPGLSYEHHLPHVGKSTFGTPYSTPFPDLSTLRIT